MSPDTVIKNNLSSPESSPEESLSKALDKFYETFQSDLDLVREGAKQHGVELTSGGMFDMPTKGAYSLRIPGDSTKRQEEITRLKACNTLTFVCMDYRQTGQVTEETHPDGVIANAGGPVQPNQDRFNASIALVRAILGVNPDVTLNLVGHVGVCGGANHFTDGHMKKLHQQDINNPGNHEEWDAMKEMLLKFYTALQEAGVKKMKVGLAKIDNDNIYQEIEWLSV